MYVIRRQDGIQTTYQDASGAFVNDITQAKQYKTAERAFEDIGHLKQSDNGFYDVAMYVIPSEKVSKTPMQPREIRALTGLGQTRFSKMYEIPLQTLQKWEQGQRTPPDYVLRLLERAVRQDIKEGKL